MRRMVTSIDALIRTRRNPFTKQEDEALDVEKVWPRSLWSASPYLRLRPGAVEELGDARGCRVGGRTMQVVGAPSRFVAQLDFGELAALHRGALPLPKEGVLGLFMETDGRAPPSLHYAPSLPDFGDPAEGRRLVAELLPSVDEKEEDGHEDSEDPLDDHRLFWARHPQGRTWIWNAIDLELRRNGLDWKPATLRAAERQGTDVVGILRVATTWRLLWQLGSDEELGLDWGDGGRLFVLIKNHDLEQQKFDCAQCVVAPFS
jgi:hypothetical protein